MNAKLNQKILILCAVDTDSNPRVLRQIRVINSTFPSANIWIVGDNNGFSKDDRIKKISIKSKNSLLIGRINLKSLVRVGLLFVSMILRSHLITSKLHSMSWTTLPNWKSSKLVPRLDYDLVIFNDIQSLPLAGNLFKNHETWIDIPEYAPQQSTRAIHKILNKPYYNWLMKKISLNCDWITTVSQGLAEKIEKDIGRTVEIVKNTPSNEVDINQEIHPASHEGEPIHLIHTGAAIRDRKIERLIQALEGHETKFKLDLYLVGTDHSYLQLLVNMASKYQNVRILDPVMQNLLPSTIMNYDAMFFSLPPINFNQEHCLPNKFFEAIQVGVPVLCGPTPEIKRYIDSFDVGAYASGFTSKDLHELLKKIERKNLENWAKNCSYFKDEFSSEIDDKVVKSIIEKAILNTK